MEFKKLKNLTLICTFTLLCAGAVSACGSADIVETATGDTPEIVTAQPATPTNGNNDPVVDPGPGGNGGGVVTGGVHPVGDVGLGEIVDGDSDDSTPPSGGGGLDNSQPGRCLTDEPFSSKKLNVTVGTNGSADDLNANDCIII